MTTPITPRHTTGPAPRRARSGAVRRARHIGRSAGAQARRELRAFAALSLVAVVCAVIDVRLDALGAGWAASVLWAGAAAAGAAGAAADQRRAARATRGRVTTRRVTRTAAAA